MNLLRKYKNYYGYMPFEHFTYIIYSNIVKVFPRQLLYCAILRSWSIACEHEENHPDFDEIPLDVVVRHIDKHSMKNFMS